MLAYVVYTHLVDMRVVRKGRGWSGPWQVSRARQDQQRADHTLTLPSAELLANRAALLKAPSPNCTPESPVGLHVCH